MEKEQAVKMQLLYTHTHYKIRTLCVANFEFIIHLDFYFSHCLLFTSMPFINGGGMFIT